MGVAVGRLDLEHPVPDVQDGDVEGAAAQVEDQDGLVLLLLQPVGQRGGGRLVDDAQHVEAGDLTGVLGGLALGVVEVGRHGDDGVRHLLAQVRLGVGLELLEGHGRDLLGREVLASVGHDRHGPILGPGLDFVRDDLALRVDLAVATAHETLDRVDGVLGVDGRLAAGELAHQPLAGLGEGDHRRSRPRTLRVGDDHGLSSLHDRDHGVRRPEVDSDGLWHLLLRR